MGKRENGYEYFLLLSTMFSLPFFFSSVENSPLCVKGVNKSSVCDVKVVTHHAKRDLIGIPRLKYR